MTDRTWQDNAAEFGALTKQGKDLRLALLVACSVEKGSGNGRPRKETSANTEVSGKASAEQFARTAGTTGDRILRHLKAWGRLAEQGLVAPAADLTPADAVTVEVSGEAVEAFEPIFAEITRQQPSGGRPRASAAEIAKAFEERPEFFVEVVRSVSPTTLDTFSKVVDTAVVDTATERREEIRRHHDRLREGKPDLTFREREQEQDEGLALAEVMGELQKARDHLRAASRQMARVSPEDRAGVIGTFVQSIRRWADILGTQVEFNVDEAIEALLGGEES